MSIFHDDEEEEDFKSEDFKKTAEKSAVFLCLKVWNNNS